MLYEKKYFSDPATMKEYLINKGFIFTQGPHYGQAQYPIQEEMRWGQANQNTACYWGWSDSAGVITFVDSNGVEIFDSMSVFPQWDITHTYITNFRATGVIFCKLKNNSILLNIAPFTFNNYSPDSGSGINELITSIQNYFTLSCEFYNPPSNIIKNGLVACTAAEEDEKWRYSWRKQNWLTATHNTCMPPSFVWTIDNGSLGNVTDLPSVQRWDTQFCLALSKVVLPEGFFSNNIYTQVMGQNEIPGMIFTVNGQRFISFCSENIPEQYYVYTDDQGDTQTDPNASIRNSLLYRPICFLLADDVQLINDHTSTQEYSDETVYAEGDYCIYNGALYICTTTIATPEPWDVTHWERTTVSTELNKN